MDRLDGVGGVDHPANVGRVAEVGRQLSPLAPDLLQLVQGGLGGVPIGGLTRRLQVADKLLPVPPQGNYEAAVMLLHVADKLLPVSPDRWWHSLELFLHVADKLLPVSPRRWRLCASPSFMSRTNCCLSLQLT